MRRALLEAVLVAGIGAVLAFTANGLSPRGLTLTKNYFPGARPSVTGHGTGSQSVSTPGQGTNSAAELLAARLREDGLQLADSNLVMQIYRDPRRDQDGEVLIDARDDEHYEAGHIPGAYHFDHFHPENYLSNVVPVCLTAQRIVFYCNGGDCDISEHAAITLRDSIGIPKEKVFVYGGGMAEWTANELPIEIGARNSGQLTNVIPSAATGKAEGMNR